MNYALVEALKLRAPDRKIRLGFDIHGVIDSFEVFTDMIKKLIDDKDIEIHVITGLSARESEKEIGKLVDLSRVSYFSIADYLESKPGVTVEWKNGMPWADDEEWNRAKMEYCKAARIDVLFDDSPTYAKYFDNIPTIYCQIHNPNRRSYKPRTDVAVTLSKQQASSVRAAALAAIEQVGNELATFPHTTESETSLLNHREMLRQVIDLLGG